MTNAATERGKLRELAVQHEQQILERWHEHLGKDKRDPRDRCADRAPPPRGFARGWPPGPSALRLVPEASGSHAGAAPPVASDRQGIGIRWEEIDEDVSVANLLRA